MSYVVNNHLNNLYVLSNKAVGPGKKSKIINVGPTSIPEARVLGTLRCVLLICTVKKNGHDLEHVKTNLWFFGLS